MCYTSATSAIPTIMLDYTTYNTLTIDLKIFIFLKGRVIDVYLPFKYKLFTSILVSLPNFLKYTIISPLQYFNYLKKKSLFYLFTRNYRSHNCIVKHSILNNKQFFISLFGFFYENFEKESRITCYVTYLTFKNVYFFVVKERARLMIFYHLKN